MTSTRPAELSKQLEHAIITGRWGAGEKLPAQPQLMQEFQVSRTCLREAISLLQVKGLISVQHGSGCYVQNLFDDVFSVPLQQLPAAEHGSQLAVMEMREVLEGEAVWFACERATDAELRDIDAEYQRMQRRADTLPVLQRAKADLTYHMLIARYSHNLIVMSLSQLLYSRFFNTIYGALSSGMLDSAGAVAEIDDQHGSIHQALMARDGVAAMAAAQYHARHTTYLLRSLS